jgi:quercetin dioxygenase-like cupin family protein
MAEATERGVARGDGYAVANLSDLGEGYGFRKIRRGLDVKELGVNAIVMPPGYETAGHYHDEQEELYLVHRGRIAMTFGDGTTHELGAGGLARVDAPTVRSVKNIGEGDAIYVVVGAKGGYVGRDGRTAEGLSAQDAPPGAQR